MSTSVAFEPGSVLIAGSRYAIRDVGTRGEIQLGGEDGLVLRPLTYGERSRIIGRLAGAPNTVDAVGAAVLRAATVQSGAGDRSLAEILALVLAGANAEAPPYATTLLTVASAAGWSLRDIDEADAEIIDQLAMQLGAAVDDPDDGWSRIVLVDDARATSLDEVRRELAERLITRAGVVANVTAPEPDAQATAAAVLSPTNTAPAPTTYAAEATEQTVRPADRATGPEADMPPNGPVAAGHGGTMPVTPDRVLGVTGTTATSPTQRERQAAPANVRPRFRLLGSTDLAAASMTPTRPDAATTPTLADTAPRPVNRVSYQPEARAAQRSLNPQPLPPKQPLNTAPTLELVRAPQSITPIPLPAPHPAPVEATRLTGWNAAPVSEPLLGGLPTLAQIETLVGDEVADALAALLDHEADLRGIDR